MYTSERRERSPDRCLCRTGDCKEIIPVSESLSTSYLIVRSFRSARLTLADLPIGARARARRCTYFAKRVSLRHPKKERERKYISRANIVSFSRPFDETASQSNRLIFVCRRYRAFGRFPQFSMRNIGKRTYGEASIPTDLIGNISLIAR